MKRRSFASIRALAVFASLLSVSALAQTAATVVPTPTFTTNAKVAATQPAPQELLMQVYVLRYAKAPEVANAIASALVEMPIRIIPDRRTNSLITAALPDGHKKIINLVKILDVPETGDFAQKVHKLYHVKYARSGELILTLQQILGSSTLTLANDASTNTIVAAGNMADLTTTEQIISALDQDNPPAVQQGRMVRIIWLVSDMDSLPAPPPDMQDVTRELESMGIGGLRLAAQSIVQTVSEGKFSVQVTPGTFQSNLRFEGLLQGAEPASLHIKLEASGVSNPQRPPQELASIQTTVTAPLKHKIVLGVAPIEEYTSVFVIQLLPGKSGGQTEGGKAAGEKTPAATAAPGSSSR